MLIEKHGNKYHEPDVTQIPYECPKCHCEFSLAKYEYDNWVKKKASYKCPECGKEMDLTLYEDQSGWSGKP